MNAEKLMKVMGHVLLWSYVAVNIIYIIRADIWEFGPEIAGKYSIYASKQFFIAYHIWGAILAAIVSLSVWKNNRKLVLLSLFLFLVVMFYPYFTSSPVDRQKANERNMLIKPPADLAGDTTKTLQPDSAGR